MSSCLNRVRESSVGSCLGSTPTQIGVITSAVLALALLGLSIYYLKAGSTNAFFNQKNLTIMLGVASGVVLATMTYYLGVITRNIAEGAS